MELDSFQKHFDAFQNGGMSRDQFASLRTLWGIYGLRQEEGRYMIRIKVPAGILSPRKLFCLASIVELFALFPEVHITTRQGIELYGVRQADLANLLRYLDEAGLITFASGGNSVRGITSCPLAGVARDEILDVTPYVCTASDYFLAHPAYRNLPRKVKIGFEGCPEDHMQIGIQDIGVFASKDGEGKPFFRIYVGGGLGTSPRVGELLEEHTRPESLLPTIESILKVFDQRGNRTNRARARLKYLISEAGMDQFRTWVFEERNKNSFSAPRVPEAWDEIPGSWKKHSACPEPPDPQKFNWWMNGSVYFQKQKGYVSVFVRCPQGNLTAANLRDLALISQHYSGGHIRTTVTQNIVLRWVHESDLASLHAALDQAGLASCCAGEIMDITRCAGADTCLSAITSCRGLALALEELFLNGLGKVEEIRTIQIKISGCPNACGQHLVAGIGFHGMAKKAGDDTIPCYRMFLGGKADGGRTQFGKAVSVVPARRVPLAVRALLEFFLKGRYCDEAFQNFIERTGIENIRKELQAYETFSASDVERENLFKDIRSDDAFRLLARRGEC